MRELIIDLCPQARGRQGVAGEGDPGIPTLWQAHAVGYGRSRADRSSCKHDFRHHQLLEGGWAGSVTHPDPHVYTRAVSYSGNLNPSQTSSLPTGLTPTRPHNSRCMSISFASRSRRHHRRVSILLRFRREVASATCSPRSCRCPRTTGGIRLHTTSTVLLGRSWKLR